MLNSTALQNLTITPPQSYSLHDLEAPTEGEAAVVFCLSHLPVLTQAVRESGAIAAHPSWNHHQRIAAAVMLGQIEKDIHTLKEQAQIDRLAMRDWNQAMIILAEDTVTSWNQLAIWLD